MMMATGHGFGDKTAGNNVRVVAAMNDPVAI